MHVLPGRLISMPRARIQIAEAPVLWHSSSDLTTTTSAYRSLGSTVTGTSGLSDLVCSGDESTRIMAGMSVRAAGTDVYTVDSVSTTLGVTTITVVGTLSTNYVGSALATLGVSQWNDKTGNGYHATQGTAGNQFGIVPNSQNGRVGLLIDVDDDYMSSPYTADWNGSDFTVFAVPKYTDTTDNYRGIIGNRFGAGAANWWTMGRDAVGNDLAVESGNGANFSYASSGVEPNGAGAKIVTFVKSGTTGTIYVNNVNSGTDDLSANNLGDETNELRIGNWFETLQSLGGLLYEILLYNRALSTEKITLTNTYLSNEWGVSI